MANSSIIGSAKNKIIKSFIKNDLIVQAINSKNKSGESLKGSHIFDYNQNPNTINDVITFITVQVHIPNTYASDKTYVNPEVEIWIISHENHMKVDNIPKVNMNRNDYLSILIDKELNGSTEFGIGKLMLACNIEGSFQQDYLFRKLLFRTKDANDLLCNDEE